MSTQKVISVIGGNGFVGQRVLRGLLRRGEVVRCISRTGVRPLHMQEKTDYAWADAVDWVKADAAELQPIHLSDTKAIICLVGAPPIPTFTQTSCKYQSALNGSANIRSIQLAGSLGIKKLVLLSAYIPKLLCSKKWGYYLGKSESIAAAKAFSLLSCEHAATVLKPSAIYGRRYMPNGKAIPLDRMLGPVEKYSFGMLVSVDSVAETIVESVLNESQRGLQFIENQLIKTTVVPD